MVETLKIGSPGIDLHPMVAVVNSFADEHNAQIAKRPAIFEDNVTVFQSEFDEFTLRMMKAM